MQQRCLVLCLRNAPWALVLCLACSPQLETTQRFSAGGDSGVYYALEPGQADQIALDIGSQCREPGSSQRGLSGREYCADSDNPIVRVRLLKSCSDGTEISMDIDVWANGRNLVRPGDATLCTCAGARANPVGANTLRGAPTCSSSDPTEDLMRMMESETPDAGTGPTPSEDAGYGPSEGPGSDGNDDDWWSGWDTAGDSQGGDQQNSDESDSESGNGDDSDSSPGDDPGGFGDGAPDI